MLMTDNIMHWGEMKESRKMSYLKSILFPFPGNTFLVG